MKTVLVICGLLATALVCCTQAATPKPAPSPAAEKRVGDWCDLARLEFTGLQTYSPAQVRKALGKHVPFLNATHPLAPRHGLLPAIEQHVRAGFLAAGFPEARVAARLDEPARRIRLTVVEGPRYRCGEVRVQGAVTIPVPEVVRRLTQPWPPVAAQTLRSDGPALDFAYLNSSGQEVRQVDAIWVNGVHANFSAPRLVAVRERVVQVLADCGYFFAEVDVQLVPQPGRGLADLEIKITAEGPHSQLGRIDVHGLTRDTPADVVRWLGLAPGQPIEPDLVARLEQRLWNSGRFTAYRVVPAPAPDGNSRVQLDLWLTEAEHGPRLSGEFSPEEKAMLKFREWLQAQLAFSSERAEDIVITLPRISGLPDDFGAVELLVSKQGLLAVQRRDAVVRTALVLTADRRIFFSADHGRKLESTTPGAQLSIFATIKPAAEPGEKYRTNLTFGAGWSSAGDHEPGGSPVKIDVLLAPVSFLRQAHEPDPPVKLTGGRLVIGGDDLALEIDAASGRIVGLRGTKPDGGKAPQVRFERGAFARLLREVETAAAAVPNQLKLDGIASSLLRGLGAELLDGPYVAKFFPASVTPEQRARAAGAFEKLCARPLLAALDRWWNDEEEAETFEIPVETPAGNNAVNAMASLLAVLVQAADAFLPAQSWPWKILREVAFAGSGDAPHLTATVESVANSADSGPLALWGAAKLLTLINSPTSGTLARRGLARLSAADFQRDCRLLFDGASGIGTALQSLASGLRELSKAEIDALAVLLPPDAAGTLRRAAQALRERPAEPLAVVLQPMLDELWETHLRGRTEAALRTVAGAAADAAEAERLFQEGMRHFSGRLGPAADRAAGARLIQQAAELGHPKAEFVYSQILTKGDGATRDLAAARDWQLRAAQHGIIEAQMTVGTAYHLGLDVPADPAEAFFWYSLAAAGGHKPAESLRNVAQRKLSPEQITAAEARLKAIMKPQPAGATGALPAAPESPRPDSPDQPQVHLRLIQLARPEGTSDAALLERANAILARLQEGERFADLAREFSNDLKRSKGGDWGWLKRSDFRALFADLAFSLQKGEVSKPTLLPEGCFLLYIEDRR